MKFAVTVISPQGYAHSAIFQEVAESVHHALLILGHDSIITEETNCPGRRHIVLGSCLLPHYHLDLMPGSILYNLEQVSPDSLWLTPDLVELFRRYPLWDYSKRNIEQFRRMGIDGVAHVPLGYVPQLTRIAAAEEDIDVLFIGSMNERRLAIIEALCARGVHAEWRFGVYGAERDQLIARAKIMLNVHYYEAKIFEAVRVSYLLANKRFVISERGSAAQEDADFANGIVFAAYDELVDTCIEYLARAERRAAIAAAGFALFSGRPQARFLEPVVGCLAAAHPGDVQIARKTDSTEVPRHDVTTTTTDHAGQEDGQEMVTANKHTPPRVSVVMPVFNHADLTASCLTSLVETTNDCDVNLELIVVDNGSTDETPALLATLIQGDITVLRNEVNRGFGEACNQGAEIAKGEYILFLNNDTLLLPCWLTPLIAALEEDQRCAAVQPRLIYPDGRLNDAGGLVFRDGEAWVYGKGARILDAPQYASRRTPDYVTGACMLIRRTAFQEVGGFDPRYAPAYYEDTDLSFALRAAGWTLLYEPAATIVHLEGGTAGTDVNTGLKQYQVRNKYIFARKWVDDLSRRPHLDPAIVDAWAHRGQGGWGPGEDPSLRGVVTQARTVLSIDPFPPLWDRAGGGLRAMHLLHSLRQEGHAVIHVAAGDATGRARYAAALSRIGVPLYGLDPADLPGDLEERALVISAFLPDLSILVHRHRPDVVVISPWSTAEYLIDPVRTLLPHALLIVDTCDVHFVRERRTAQLAAEPVLTQQVEANRRRELAVYAKADRIVCVSEEDAAAVREALPGCDVAIAGLAHDEVDPGPGFAERSGLLFVGNANHPPNREAVHWWRAEIAPRLATRLPGIRLAVVGNDPAGVMRPLAGHTMDILGWVPDTLPYLHAARLSVAPLRSGAGVKIKVGEALMAGLPVIGTSIAAEGLGLINEHQVLIADDADTFVEQIVRAYTDPILWDRLRANGLSHARAHFGRAKLRAAVPAIVAPRNVSPNTWAPLAQIGTETADRPEIAARISLVMNSHNEARNLSGAIESCAGVAEIVVADMASDDGTVEIARRFGATALALPLTGYCEPGRQPAIDAASCDRVLLLDADERSAPGGDTYTGKACCRDTGTRFGIPVARSIVHWREASVRHRMGVEFERHPRFFRRHDISWPTHIHATPTFTGDVSELPAGTDVWLNHYGFTDLEAAYAKFNRYTSIEAAERFASGAAAVQPSQILADAIAEFEQRYEPVRDGAMSLALSMGMFMYRFMTGMKVIERSGWPESLTVPGRDAMLAAWSSFRQTLQEADSSRVPLLVRKQEREPGGSMKPTTAVRVYQEGTDVGYLRNEQRWWFNHSFEHSFTIFDLDSFYQEDYFREDHVDSQVVTNYVEAVLTYGRMLLGRNVRSVLEIGAGGGWFARGFLDQGITVLAVEGSRAGVNKARQRGVPEHAVMRHDLRQPLDLDRKFDMVLCTEVAEHIECPFSSQLIANLTRHSDVIWFSFESPGTNEAHYHHCNEQPEKFWRNLFRFYGFDMIRIPKEVQHAVALRGRHLFFSERISVPSDLRTLGDALPVAATSLGGTRQHR